MEKRNDLSMQVNLPKKRHKIILPMGAALGGLPVYHSMQKTNNCSEVYHRGLKSLVRVKKPNIWAFIESLEKTLKKMILNIRD